MKEDYLWDKTGADPEIERLETALRAFRYQETAPPALPANVLPFKKEAPPRRAFRFAMAMAACLTFGILAFGIWLQILRNNIETDSRLAETKPTLNDMTPPKINSASEPALIQKPDEAVVDKTFVKAGGKQKQSIERKFIRVRRAVPMRPQQKEIKAQYAKAVKPEVQLTQEEQYAYNQLMTALSITSSKLKLVKDKVEGMEE